MLTTIGKAWYWAQSRIIKIFGDIKFFPAPFFFVYDPGSYRVRGYEVRQVLEQIRPGDILLRGYNKYLNGYFIPGNFSHAGLYLGQVEPCDKPDGELPENFEQHFRPGRQMVVHSMAHGVFMEDVIDFCRCDKLLILRFPDRIEVKPEHASLSDRSDFTDAEIALAEKLEEAEAIEFREAWPIVRNEALRNVGTPYDFSFNFKNYNNMSCTEFLQKCIRALTQFHGVTPIKQRHFGIFNKTIIEPDSYNRECFEKVWKSKEVTWIDDAAVQPTADPKEVADYLPPEAV